MKEFPDQDLVPYDSFCAAINNIFKSYNKRQLEMHGKLYHGMDHFGDSLLY